MYIHIVKHQQVICLQKKLFWYLHYKIWITGNVIHIFIIYINIYLTLQASATVMPYWYLADIDLGMMRGKFIVGCIFCKHNIIAFIKVSWAILVNAVSFSENSLNKHKITVKI